MRKKARLAVLLFVTGLLIAGSALLGSASRASAQHVGPEWLGRSSETWRMRREPQVESRQSLFRNARDTAGPLDGALLVSRRIAERPSGNP